MRKWIHESVLQLMHYSLTSKVILPRFEYAAILRVLCTAYLQIDEWRMIGRPIKVPTCIKWSMIFRSNFGIWCCDVLISNFDYEFFVYTLKPNTLSPPRRFLLPLVLLNVRVVRSFLQGHQGASARRSQTRTLLPWWRRRLMCVCVCVCVCVYVCM